MTRKGTTRPGRGDRKGRSAAHRSLARLYLFCEGATEASYFEDMKEFFRVHNLKVCPVNVGKEPSQIYEAAVNRLDAIRKDTKERHYTSQDTVVCVFDRDEHARFQDVVNRGIRDRIRCFWSTPCFEFWILLHSDTPTMKCMTSREAEREVERRLGVSKPYPNLYGRISAQQDMALRHAESIRSRYARDAGCAQESEANIRRIAAIQEWNPYTLIDRLVRDVQARQ